MNYSWQKWYETAHALETDLGIKKAKEGWHRKGNDTMLLTKEGEGFLVRVWNDDDPREELKRLLTLPEYTET